MEDKPVQKFKLKYRGQKRMEMEKRVKEIYGTWWKNPNVCVINIPGEEKQWCKNCFQKLTKAMKPHIQEIP